jgi:hypothetical protein
VQQVPGQRRTADRRKEKLVKLESEMQRLAAMERSMLASPDQQTDSRSMATQRTRLWCGRL